MDAREKKFEEVRFFWKHCGNISDASWQLIARLNYSLTDEFSVGRGTWKVYVKQQPLVFSKLGKGSECFNFFFAVFFPSPDERKFAVCGEYEELPSLKDNLVFLTRVLDDFKGKRRFSVPTTLTLENSQDFGYVRGLMFGACLMILDLVYSSLFKLRSGVLTTFLEYTKLVYMGTPGFAIVVGMAAIGVYFGVLFIALPIAAGSFYRWKAHRLLKHLAREFPAEAVEYDFGVNAEKRLEDQHDLIVESLQKDAMYRDIARQWETLSKQDFEEVYFAVKEGFLTPDSFLSLLETMAHNVPEFDLRKFLRVYVKYASMKPEVTLGFPRL